MSSMLELPPALAEPLAAPAPAREPHLRLVQPAPLDFDEAARSVTPRLLRYATRRLGDAHEAEELVQEALLRAYKHAAQLQTEDDLIAWCTVVTGRLVIDRLRVRGRSVNVAEVPEGTRVGRDTAEVVVARDEARMALDALDAMPSRQAAVLWAREVEGQGYDEIGRRFGMTEPAVRSILTRARKALRKEYAARGGTLPVAGLAALAPWITGLRWADRLRSAATRLAAPVAIGAMALGLVGGALHSPYAGGSAKAPTTAQAVVSRQVAANGLDRPNPALTRPTAAHAATGSGTPAALTKTANTHSVLRRSQIATTCTPTANMQIGASGGSECTTGDKGSMIYVGQRLPDNPTGANYLGVETPLDCKQTPTTPITKCQPSTQNPGAKS
ncbi:MAG: polymerase sigma-70 factor, subfamily [Actinomycetota bacterium]|jgi:RNA polymerase sigma-70 factor (ECF subfamily)|nr:polymerase sigma-70 factor, subfamily [Actinomycetota bacterium]